MFFLSHYLLLFVGIGTIFCCPLINVSVSQQRHTVENTNLDRIYIYSVSNYTRSELNELFVLLEPDTNITFNNTTILVIANQFCEQGNKHFGRGCTVLLPCNLQTIDCSSTSRPHSFLSYIL